MVGGRVVVVVGGLVVVVDVVVVVEDVVVGRAVVGVVGRVAAAGSGSEGDARALLTERTSTATSTQEITWNRRLLARNLAQGPPRAESLPAATWPCRDRTAAGVAGEAVVGPRWATWVGKVRFCSGGCSPSSIARRRSER